MSIVAIIKEALRIVRAHKSLWVFGFVVGLGAVSNGGGGQVTPPAAAGPEPGTVLLLVGAAVVIALVVLKFVSTGALIEGVKRARVNAAMTVREGLREGWAHWGVLLRIALTFLAANAASVVLLVGVCYLVAQVFGPPAAFVAGALAAIVGVPWLVTLHMWQAFAERIAVFENRHALDAIRKARLFLHGRLQHGLKLVVAALLGVLFVGALGLVLIGPLAALFAATLPSWGLGAVAIGALTLLPAIVVVIAVIGVVTSSVWTIGYLTQAEQ